MVNNTVWYHLLVLTWGLRYIWKRGNIRKGSVETEDWGTFVYFVLRYQGNSNQTLSAFNCFLIIKGILKAFFSFIPWLNNLNTLNIKYSAQQEQMKVQVLETCECSGQISPNSCHFWNKSVFLQIFEKFQLFLECVKNCFKFCINLLGHEI